MEQVLKWYWNGRFGRLARRDIKIIEDDGKLIVTALNGGTEGRLRQWDVPSEDAALRLVADLQSDSDGWQDMGHLL